MNTQTTAPVAAPKKGKPGELMLLLGALCLFVAPLLWFILAMTDLQYETYQSEGVVSQAVVKNKAVRSESYTDRKGRPKSRTIHSVTVEYDLNSMTKYSDWKVGGAIAKSPYPAITSADIDGPSSYYDQLNIGEKTTVVRVPADYKSLMLAERLQYETSWEYHLHWYLGLAAAFLAGMVLMVLGWRKRRAHV